MTYWIVTLTVLIIGFLTGFSVGIFILPIGVALLLLGPVRYRPRLFWPILTGVVGFEFGYLLFVPLTCTATATIPGGEAETICTSILGPSYRAQGIAAPPTDVALLVGGLVGASAGVATLAVLTISGKRNDRA
ncbi:MAG TPA: hypothetical protein VFU17_15760 [Candidatus Limnocylindrales bacterium]|nr:hypothetical protein [Candidatus Limnocylindrales bacterium]